jgi:hypothetical protein
LVDGLIELQLRTEYVCLPRAPLEIEMGNLVELALDEELQVEHLAVLPHTSCHCQLPGSVRSLGRNRAHVIGTAPLTAGPRR